MSDVLAVTHYTSVTVAIRTVAWQGMLVRSDNGNVYAQTESGTVYRLNTENDGRSYYWLLWED